VKVLVQRQEYINHPSVPFLRTSSVREDVPLVLNSHEWGCAVHNTHLLGHSLVPIEDLNSLFERYFQEVVWLGHLGEEKERQRDCCRMIVRERNRKRKVEVRVLKGKETTATTHEREEAWVHQLLQGSSCPLPP